MKHLFSFFAAIFIATVAHADVLGQYSFEGKLGTKIFVELKFAINGDDIAVGEVLYPNAKHPAPILVVGTYEEETGRVNMQEFTNDGTVTGIWSFIVEGEGNEASLTDGVWTNPQTEKTFTMNNFRPNDEFVDIPKYLDYEDPQNIGREYSYSIYNPRYKSMMGGTVKFRGAGKWKLHFEVSNCPGNIAEGKSEPGRPAVLGEATHDYFYYDNVNECGYSFGAYFFKKFVVLVSTSTKPEAFQCFGNGVAFDGVYMKVKQ